MDPVPDTRHERSPARARPRAAVAAIVVGLLWALLVQGATLGAEPTTEPAASSEPTATAEATGVPTAEATATATADSPLAAATPSPTPVLTPSPSPSPSPSPTPIAPAPTATPTAAPAATARPAPTVTPTPTPTTAPAPTPQPISGFRYTTVATRLYSARSLGSTPLASLTIDTQVTVSETLSVSGTSWTTVSYGGALGYVPSNRLSLTSRPVADAATRWVGRPSALRPRMSLSAGASVAVPYGATITTVSSALDEAGRRWYRASWSSGGITHSGYLRTADTTSLPWAVRSGPWTAVGSQVLLHYPWSAGPARRTLADGARVYRLQGLRDADGVVWVLVTAGTDRGWLRHEDLTGPYSLFMWDRRDPVTQQMTNYWCVPASVQTELNMALNWRSTSRSFQQAAYSYGRANLGYRIQARGLDPQAWARSLTYFSGGRVRYADTTFGTFTASLRAAAERMRATGYPIGILVYHGGHAWTMIGFTATADPAVTSHYTITGVYVAAPFVAWTDPRPGTYYTTIQIRAKMTTYWEPERWTRWNGHYTVILPVS